MFKICIISHYTIVTIYFMCFQQTTTNSEKT